MLLVEFHFGLFIGEARAADGDEPLINTGVAVVLAETLGEIRDAADVLDCGSCDERAAQFGIRLSESSERLRQAITDSQAATGQTRQHLEAYHENGLATDAKSKE